MSTMQSQQQRGGCLTIWLVLGMIGGVLSIISYLTSSSAFMQSYPAASSVTFIVLAVASVLVVIGSYGLWTWHKWGLYLYILAAIIAIAIDFTLGFGLPTLIGGLIGIGILWLLLRNKWAMFT